MIDITLAPFEAWHLFTLHDQQTEIVSIEDMRFLARIYEERGMGYSAKEGDVIIGCAGVLRMWNRVGELWTVLTPYIRRKYPVWLTKTVKTLMLRLAESMNLVRLQTVVNADDPIAIRWAERAMGLEYEGTLRNYGPDGSDFFLYSRIRT